MGLKTRVERVGQNGEIKIPRDYMKALCLSPGQEVKPYEPAHSPPIEPNL